MIMTKPLDFKEISSYLDLDFTERNKVIIAISKPKNFFNTYFNNLKNFNTRVECFNKLNDLHYEVYGTQMYSSWHSFQTVYTRYLRNKK
jgi:hypothetical protein